MIYHYQETIRDGRIVIFGLREDARKFIEFNAVMPGEYNDLRSADIEKVTVVAGRILFALRGKECLKVRGEKIFIPPRISYSIRMEQADGPALLIREFGE